MTNHWHPTEVLELTIEPRCVGHNRNGGKCSSFIGAENFKTFKSEIKKLAKLPLDPKIIEPKLRILAELGLCLRRHQDQVEEMVTKWIDMVREAYPPVLRTQIPRPLPASLREADPVAPPSGTRQALRDMASRVAARWPASDVSDPSTSRRSRRPASFTAAPRPQAQPSEAPAPCGGVHVRRLSLAEECAVCFDEVPLSACEPSDVVWCKAGCGRSTHATCLLGKWRAQCQRDMRPLTCPLCRAAWAEGCVC